MSFYKSMMGILNTVRITENVLKSGKNTRDSKTHIVASYSGEILTIVLFMFPYSTLWLHFIEPMK